MPFIHFVLVFVCLILEASFAYGTERISEEDLILEKDNTSKPAFVKTRQVIFVREDKPPNFLRLRCGIKNLGDKKVSWYWTKNNETLVIGIGRFYDLKYHVINVDEFWTLEIWKPREEDGGMYKCQINTVPPMSLLFQIQFYKTPCEVPFSTAYNYAVRLVDTSHEHLTVWEGQTTVLRCEMSFLDLYNDDYFNDDTHYPVKWTRRRDMSELAANDVTCTSDSRFHARKTINFRRPTWFELTIASPNLNDSGEYECQLHPGPGQDLRKVFTLKVIENNPEAHYFTGGYWITFFNSPAVSSIGNTDLTWKITNDDEGSALLCAVKTLWNRKVYWVRHGTKQEQINITCDSKTVWAFGDSGHSCRQLNKTGDWKLFIYPSVTEGGTFECKVTSEPEIKISYHITVCAEENGTKTCNSALSEKNTRGYFLWIIIIIYNL